MTEALSALVLVFIAELGDKSQIVALGLGARYSLRRVLAGIVVGYVVALGLAVVVGASVGAAFPTRAVTALGGVLFLGFAVWTALRPDDTDERPSEMPVTVRGGRLGVVASVAAAIFVAEVGDKTMLATATLAAQGGAVPVFAGSIAGIVLAGALAVFAGRTVGRLVSARAVRLGSAVLFGLFGVVLLLAVR